MLEEIRFLHMEVNHLMVFLEVIKLSNKIEIFFKTLNKTISNETSLVYFDYYHI